MSHVIELREEVYIRAKISAEKEGVSPEVWIENLIDDRTAENRGEISDEQRAEWHRYSKELDKKFGEALKEKFRKQGLQLGEK